MAEQTVRYPSPTERQELWRAGMPNVLVVVLDDVGFAQLGCYGSDIDTPNLDRIANSGIRFSNFHTTALCSPTRASLMTGRNHHRVGFGWHPELPMLFPGYSGRIPREAAFLPEVLQNCGYGTFATGKWHMTPIYERTPAGPYGQWPTGRGFDHYYGFLGGDTNQWAPVLTRDTSMIDPPATPEQGYHFNEDMADQSIGYLRELRKYQGDRPFFLYYSTGAMHAPHQAPAEWIDRYRGRFDGGWDEWRERVIARQKELGVVAEEAVPSPRPSWVAPWDSLSHEEKIFTARTMEAFAGYLSHTDHHIGRVLDEIEAMGELDNTVVVVLSDNGASAQGGPHGSSNEMRWLAGHPEDFQRDYDRVNEIGGFKAYNHYAWGWAHAGNTPFRRWKKYTWEGGTRTALILRPPGADARPEVRDQYAYVTDLYPTILELCGIALPEEVNGYKQMSVDGVSLVSVLEDAEAPEVRTTQYYELEGSRALYHNGWKIVTNHVYQGQMTELELVPGSHDFSTDRWLLFNARHDPAENEDLARELPDLVSELERLWWYEAGQNNVLPLTDRSASRIPQMDLRWRPTGNRVELAPGEKHWSDLLPILHRTAFSITAEFDDAVLGEGLLAEVGDWNGGMALFVKSGRIEWVFNAMGDRVYRLAGKAPAGLTTVTVSFQPAEVGGTATLAAQGETWDSVQVESHIPRYWNPSGGFLRAGHGSGFPVVDEYRNPWPYARGLSRVVVESDKAALPVLILNEYVYGVGEAST